jgi:hypothetical protein
VLPTVIPFDKGLFSMSEVNDISRRRVADFFAARLKGRRVENNETQQSSQDSRPSASKLPEENQATTHE